MRHWRHVAKQRPYLGADVTVDDIPDRSRDRAASHTARFTMTWCILLAVDGCYDVSVFSRLHPNNRHVYQRCLQLATKHISSILYCTKNKCNYLRPLKYACHKLNDGKLNVYLVNNRTSVLQSRLVLNNVFTFILLTAKPEHRLGRAVFCFYLKIGFWP